MSFEWQVPVIVLGIVVGIFLFLRRPTVESGPGSDGGPDGGLDPGSEGGADLDREPSGPVSGRELVDGIQRTLGIGIVVDAVESSVAGAPVTIRATFMDGQNTTQATVTGDTETDAWQELAKAAVAWRNSDYQHLPMWWGGAG